MFKSAGYGGKSARNQNFASKLGWILRCRSAFNLPKDVFSIRIHSSALGDHPLSQKLLVDVGVDMLAKNWSLAA
jgi:hypothetical protein